MLKAYYTTESEAKQSILQEDITSLRMPPRFQLFNPFWSGFHLENFPWGGSSLGSSCYVCTNVVPSLACGAVTSLACHESACAYDLILVVISLGGKLASLGGSFRPAPPPPVDETLLVPCGKLVHLVVE